MNKTNKSSNTKMKRESYVKPEMKAHYLMYRSLLCLSIPADGGNDGEDMENVGGEW